MNEDLRIERVNVAPPQAVLLRLSGGLDAQGGRRLLDACAPFRNAGTSLVLGLQGVTFLTSSGIGVLLALTEEMRDCGATLQLASPSPVARMAISLLNLDGYLTLVDREPDALDAAA